MLTEMDWIGIAIGFAAGATLMGGIWYGLTKKRQKQIKVAMEKFSMDMDRFVKEFHGHIHPTPMGKSGKPNFVPSGPPMPYEDKKGDASDKG